ncbi:hypothetical protein HUG17_4575 [Dermatophagoides farinae]|nr:hypothetical protein HUG17_4575 [Dermatophagoides farinae]
MEQSEVIYEINQDNIIQTEQQQKPVTSTAVEIKQEITENNMEIENDHQILIEQEGYQVSLDDFVNFHNDQIKSMKEDNHYLTKGFDIMYKYKTVLDLIIDDYFKDDKHFKYKTIVESLETDLVTFIADDEEKYQQLIQEVNTDIVLNEENQLEFVELENPNQEEEEVVNGINEFGPSIIRKLPGQKSAPPPECPACGLKTRSRLKLEGHLLEHEDNPLVVCNHENCETAFALHELTQHEKDYHPDVCLICEMCNDVFDNKTTLVQHYKLHISKKEKLKCNFPGCDYTDIYAGRLDRHKKTAHNIEVTRQFKCDFEGCGRIFKDRPSYYTHSLIHKDRNLVYKHKCTYENCGAVFKRRRNLALHMLKHGYVKRKYTCMFGECRRTYAREKELMRHIEVVHRAHFKNEPTDGEELAANETGNEDENKNDDDSNTEDGVPSVKRFRKNKSIESEYSDSHLDDNDDSPANTAKKILFMMNKSSSNPQELEIIGGSVNDIFQDNDLIGTDCELCQKNFESAEALMNHLKDRHHQYTVKAYRCDYENCEFATHFRSILGKHKNNVHGGKYKCEVCGKLSKDSGNHNRHRNIHKNILYRCRVAGCDAVYKSPKAYYVHVLTHSNEQPVYACDHPGCKYITYYVNTLNVHKLTHSDIRSFFCPYENCGKGFKRNGDLNKHIIHSHKGVKRPQKKRQRQSNNDSQVIMFRCKYEGCSFTSADSDQISKHEEEHEQGIVTENVEEEY